MNNNRNIGEWTAIVTNKGKTPQIKVNGTFPTNGEKPGYHLNKNDPQGINQTELLLTLVFGRFATSEGKTYFSVGFNEAIETIEKYKTFMVIDDNNRTIANISVSQT